MATSQDSKNLALILWVTTIFFGFIPGLIGYLIKKDDSYVLAQSKEALNWVITALIAYAIATVLTFIIIGAFLYPIISLCHLIFCILGVLKVSKGEDYRVPFAIRLLK